MTGLTRKNFVSSVRNNFYFVLVVVPIQTALALFLALIVNQKRLRGKGFFRTAFYMPSLSSSIAIGFIFLFLFQRDGAINAILSAFGAGDRQWFNNGDGTLHAFAGLVGIDDPPGFLADHGFLGHGLVGLAERAVLDDGRHHRPGHLDDVGNVHADVPLRVAGGARKTSTRRRRSTARRAGRRCATSRCRCSRSTSSSSSRSA